ncbi:MAG: alpha-1,4-glucan--maltose-1-phosphate maltosyltransferase [SAR202 cluster bacterium]|nr:alpha-1,4-glucan--maltose-1-phosphate maltosyltransferase [SAR202 cluster bacterium]
MIQSTRQTNVDSGNLSQNGRRRAVIESVEPEIDSGRFPVKQTIGEEVVVEADVFADGHDTLSVALLYRKQEEAIWREKPMEPLGNDRWRGAFSVEELGRYKYTILASVDRFKTWANALEINGRAGQDLSQDLIRGAEILAETASRATGGDATDLLQWSDRLTADAAGHKNNWELGLDPKLSQLMDAYPDRSLATTYSRELEVVVDREKARFSTWYEMFPRSCSPKDGVHATFEDCVNRLPYIAEMGFDVLYLPPIHPIGSTGRKGKNNSTQAMAHDIGSPWGIGGADGGHMDIHPELGTMEDFRELVAKATEHGMEIALDLAFQCSPDHPYVASHPDWFRHRPDGSIQFAENPPKRYEDIYPFDFESPLWPEIWEELKAVILHWANQGVRIFRVDNPHTKSFPFWEWVIGEIKNEHPDVFFLAEAFTRPKVMYRLAKVGFSQSYTYFTWKNAKWELEQYFTEIVQPSIRDFFRPNLWPNTPDILSEYLQVGGRPAFVARLVLAATLGANYGIYGPSFELMERTPREPGSEEYLDSEKYQLRHWEMGRPDNLAELIGRVNQIRRDNLALHRDARLSFHTTDNDQLICYSKRTDDGSNVVLVVVNLDPHRPHSGVVDLSLDDLGLEADESFQVHDLLTDTRFLWGGQHNFIELDPQVSPARVFRILSRLHSEWNFDDQL